MPKRIYLAAGTTSASVIKIDGECYTVVGDGDREPDQTGPPGEFETCQECEDDGSGNGSGSGSGSSGGGNGGGGGGGGGSRSGGSGPTHGGSYGSGTYEI